VQNAYTIQDRTVDWGGKLTYSLDSVVEQLADFAVFHITHITIVVIDMATSVYLKPCNYDNYFRTHVTCS